MRSGTRWSAIARTSSHYIDLRLRRSADRSARALAVDPELPPIAGEERIPQAGSHRRSTPQLDSNVPLQSPVTAGATSPGASGDSSHADRQNKTPATSSDRIHQSDQLSQQVRYAGQPRIRCESANPALLLTGWRSGERKPWPPYETETQSATDRRASARHVNAWGPSSEACTPTR